MSLIYENDIAYNEEFINEKMFIHNIQRTEQTNITRDVILKFAIDNDILFRNLDSESDENSQTDDQKQTKDLLNILQKISSTHPLDENLLNVELMKWKQTLRNAILGQGNEIHTSQKDVIRHFQEKGFLPAKYWLTDSDIENYFGKVATSADIKNPGQYIMKPISGDLSLTPLIDSVTKSVKQSVQSGNVGEYEILYPINTGNSHWCVFSLKFSNTGHITESEFWDPIKTDEENIRSTQAYKNCNEALSNVEGNIKVAFGKQPVGNNHSCGDCTIQEIERKTKRDNKITRSKQNVDFLRLGIIEQILNNDVKMKANDSPRQELSINARGQIIRSDVVSREEIIQILKKVSGEIIPAVVPTKEEKIKQVNFDEIFAKHLALLYSQKGNENISDELKLVEKAKKLAEDEYTPKQNYVSKQRFFVPAGVKSDVGVSNRVQGNKKNK